MSDNDQDDAPESPHDYANTEHTFSSPPPSFQSRASSPSSRRLLSSDDPIASEAERTLADTFDDGSDSDDDNRVGDDRQRLMRTNTIQSNAQQRAVSDGDRPNLPGTITRMPDGDAPPVAFNVTPRPYAGVAPITAFSHSNDGVFANLNAKPERGEKLEEQPPVRRLRLLLHLSEC